MKTIETKPGVTLVFQEYGGKIDRDLLTLIVEGIDNGNTPIVIGKLSEITEEQARELMNQERALWSNPVYKNYRYDDIITTSALKSLATAAESLGIKEEEFDQYLVIKL